MTHGLLAAFRIAGLLLAVALQTAWLFQPVPIATKILPVAMLILSAARPTAGLLLLAGLGPMANAISLWLQSPVAGIRLLEQLVLAFVTAAGLRWWHAADRARLGATAALLAASAAASFIAVQPALLLQRLPGIPMWDHVRALLVRGDYFVRSNVWDPLFFAALTIEGVALAVAVERVVRRHPESAGQALRMAVAGQAGVAALNVQQAIGAAIRSGDAWREISRIVRDLRVSLFYDVNAAGSVFVLHFLAGVGLLRTSAFRWLTVALLTIVMFGIWLAGSRMALVALVITGLAMVCLATIRSGARLKAAGIAVAGIVVAAALAVALYPSTRNISLKPAATARQIMAETSLNMWKAAPVFGIGVGRFFEESSRFGAAALVTKLGAPPNENAHNYFLQVLSTEGLIGLAALLMALGTVLAPAVRAERAASVPLRRWLLAGVVACLLTWLTGHPQLVPEAAFAFWLLFGVLAASTPVPGARWPAAVAVAAVVLLATGPFRASHGVSQMDFEHVGVGLSPWQPEADGFRYRLAGPSFMLYLPADGRSVDLPLRRAPGAPDPLAVTIVEAGRKLYEPLLSGDAWQVIRVQLPKSTRRFAPVEFTVSAVGTRELPSPALHVGKAEPR